MNKPNAMSDMKTFTKIAQEYSSMEQLVNSSKQYIDNINLLNEYKEILNGNDKELIDISKEEIKNTVSISSFLANGAGARGTPTLFINEEFVGGYIPINKLEQLLN